MNSTSENKLILPNNTNYIRQGTGRPVVMIHGVAASLHDWDDLIPELSGLGYECYALDLLGHGDSPKLDSRAYQMDWLLDHFSSWMESLNLNEAPILIGHSLGGYIALEYTRRVSSGTRGMVLVNPLYSLSQLPRLVQRTYRRPHLSSFVIEKTPGWIFRFIVDMSSMAMGQRTGALHSLSERIRAQTALDYTRTAPGIYNVLNNAQDLGPHLPSIAHPSLVVWGDRDQTLAPASFTKMVNDMPGATGRSIRAGHVPHQSNAEEFHQMVIEFLKNI